MDDRREPLYIFGRANPPIEQRGQSPPNRGGRYRRHGVVMGGRAGSIFGFVPSWGKVSCQPLTTTIL